VSAASDHFLDGARSITTALRPRFAGWIEFQVGREILRLGGVARGYFHPKTHIAVISAVEVADDGKIDKGPEYHISISRQTPMGPRRCTSDTARWVLKQFGLEGSEEDNHVPGGMVRNFWRPVANPLVGLECECKDEEPAIVEDKGDFIWRAAP
jgi:hypothetical protein